MESIWHVVKQPPAFARKRWLSFWFNVKRVPSPKKLAHSRPNNVFSNKPGNSLSGISNGSVRGLPSLPAPRTSQKSPAPFACDGVPFFAFFGCSQRETHAISGGLYKRRPIGHSLYLCQARIMPGKGPEKRGGCGRDDVSQSRNRCPYNAWFPFNFPLISTERELSLHLLGVRDATGGSVGFVQLWRAWSCQTAACVPKKSNRFCHGIPR